jgi:hypothetical protein
MNPYRGWNSRALTYTEPPSTPFFPFHRSVLFLHAAAQVKEETRPDCTFVRLPIRHVDPSIWVLQEAQQGVKLVANKRRIIGAHCSNGVVQTKKCIGFCMFLTWVLRKTLN